MTHKIMGVFMLRVSCIVTVLLVNSKEHGQAIVFESLRDSPAAQRQNVPLGGSKRTLDNTVLKM